MSAFLTQFVSFALSVITSVALLFTPATQASNLTNVAYAKSFGQLRYEYNINELHLTAH